MKVKNIFSERYPYQIGKPHIKPFCHLKRTDIYSVQWYIDRSSYVYVCICVCMSFSMVCVSVRLYMILWTHIYAFVNICVDIYLHQNIRNNSWKFYLKSSRFNSHYMQTREEIMLKKKQLCKINSLFNFEIIEVPTFMQTATPSHIHTTHILMSKYVGLTLIYD